jgi:hypothetical protein
MSVLSLYIPVIGNTSEEYIIKMFNTHNIGKVMRVDFVFNKVKNRREAFVHFDEWFTSDESKQLQRNIMDPNTKTQFKYHGEKFWPLLVNRNAHKRVENPNYEILNKAEVKNVFKTAVVIPFTKHNKPAKAEQANQSKCIKVN